MDWSKFTEKLLNKPREPRISQFEAAMAQEGGSILRVAALHPWPSWTLGEAHRLIEAIIRELAETELARRT